MPPREALGWFTTPGKCAAIAEWLVSERCNSLVISLDMLCFGGLVASRTPKVPLATALARLEALREFRACCPEAALYAFSTITRLGTTVARQEDLEAHLLLRAYCQALDRAERLGEADAWTELAEIERRLDPAIRDAHLAVRRRNHAVNRAAVELAAEGVLDYLVLAQEDAAPVGIHIPEQLALRDQLLEQHASDRVIITCGADEMGSLLLARHICAAAGRQPAIAVEYDDDSAATLIPAFESQPLGATVASHLAIAGARPAAAVSSGTMLLLHTPVGRQADWTMDATTDDTGRFASQAATLIKRATELSSRGLAVGIADLAYCNGGDPALVERLEHADLLARLAGYAGWNTAANTLGTVIAQLCCTACAPADTGPNHTAARRFLLERLTDDGGYQPLVRSHASARARALGADPFALGEAAEEMEEFIRAELTPLAARYASRVSGGAPEPVRVSLPWRRLFEVEVEAAPSHSG